MNAITKVPVDIATHWKNYLWYRTFLDRFALNEWLFEHRKSFSANRLICADSPYVAVSIDYRSNPDKADYYFDLTLNGINIGGCIARYYENYLHLVGVQVDKDYQGYGYGQLIIETVISCASTLTTVKLISLDVFKDNFRARYIYAKYGFRNTRDYGEAYRMERKL